MDLHEAYQPCGRSTKPSLKATCPDSWHEGLRAMRAPGLTHDSSIARRCLRDTHMIRRRLLPPRASCVCLCGRISKSKRSIAIDSAAARTSVATTTADNTSRNAHPLRSQPRGKRRARHRPKYPSKSSLTFEHVVGQPELGIVRRRTQPAKRHALSPPPPRKLGLCAVGHCLGLHRGAGPHLMCFTYPLVIVPAQVSRTILAAAHGRFKMTSPDAYITATPPHRCCRDGVYGPDDRRDELAVGSPDELCR